MPADLESVRELLRAAGLPADDIGIQSAGNSVVAVSDANEVVGTESIEIYGRTGLLRSAVVAESWRGRGIGQALTRDRLAMANAAGLEELYLLTTTAAAYWARFGFTTIDRADVSADVLAASEFSTSCPSSATVMRINGASLTRSWRSTAGRDGACCGDPTPHASAGACCSHPSSTCGCHKLAVLDTLMRAFLPACAGAGLWRLMSRIFPANASSRALCSRHGFREAGTYAKHAVLDGVWRDAAIVERGVR